MKKKTSSDFWYERTAEIKDNKLHYTYEDSDYYEDHEALLELEQLFETEKQAEWALKYQHIPRTEYLDLPTWEEFFNSGKSIVFRDAYGDIQELKHYNREIYLNGQYRGYLTEDNYTAACKLCLKLFKGEE